MAGIAGEDFFPNVVAHLAGIFEAAYAFIGMVDEADADHVTTLAVHAHGGVTENFSYALEGTPCANVVGQTTCSHPTGVQAEFPTDTLLAEMKVDSYIGSPLFGHDGTPLGLLVVMDTGPLKEVPQATDLMEIFAARTSVELERLRMEEDLRESQRLLKLVLDSIPVRVFWKDRESVYLGCNEHFAHDAGLDSPEAIVGKTDFELGWREQAELYRADDHEVMETGVARLDYEEPQSGEHGERRWLRTSKLPLRDEHGRVFGVLGIYEDITERRHTEEALRRSQKMEAIGQLSGGIAHDFNNQLGVVIGYLDFLRNRHRDDERQQQWVETASRATLRCMDLTRQLLAFSRRQARETRIIDINAAVRELEDMVARSLTPEVEVRYHLAEDLWQTEIDPGEFQDAMLNLVINARDAMPHGGTLSIETANLRIDAESSDGSPELEAGDYVQLRITDTGGGMDGETLGRIFEPFFTTKPEGKGTGLGLAMVYGFARRYGGSVSANSEQGRGTCFCLYLPRAGRAAPVPRPDDTNADVLPGGSEAILVVDDEVDLLRLAETYLLDLGYRVHTAENAAQAVEVLEGDTHLDLLFTDVVMPGGMNGYELARSCAELRPGLPVLLTSGFTSRARPAEADEQPGVAMLNKPYRKEDLARRVREALDAVKGGATASSQQSERTSLADRRVLVVDDEEDMRMLFELKLERLGVVVRTAATGEEAIARYAEAADEGRPFDAAIVDLSLPGGMGGAAVAKELRRLDPRACLIVSSGDPDAAEMRDPEAHGFSASMAKDVDTATLKASLAQILARC